MIVSCYCPECGRDLRNPDHGAVHTTYGGMRTTYTCSCGEVSEWTFSKSVPERVIWLNMKSTPIFKSKVPPSTGHITYDMLAKAAGLNL